jgi:hypothetical protein
VLSREFGDVIVRGEEDVGVRLLGGYIKLAILKVILVCEQKISKLRVNVDAVTSF